jgi:hypothetical protein
MVDDARDDELAARLQVEPLDEVTRRRLVRRALAEPAVMGTAPPEPIAPERRDRSRRTRFVAAAAVLLVVAVGVVSLLATSNSQNDSTEAGRRSDQAVRAAPQAGSGSAAAQVAPAGNADQSTPTAGGASSAEAFGDAGVTNLGDVGDLTAAPARRRLLATIDATPFATTGGAGVAAATDAGGLTGTCPLTDVAHPLAAGTATFDGRGAFVVVDQRGDGSRRVRLVISNPCEVRQLR